MGDAFRSVFPTGTVSGAPKMRAVQLISQLEGEKRGVYAGAVGWFGYDVVREEGEVVEGPVDNVYCYPGYAYQGRSGAFAGGRRDCVRQ